MHPKALLQACTDLLEQVLKFEHPADAVVARWSRDHRSLGPRERATLADTVYAVLRRKLFFEHLAPSGSGPRARRLAILGFQGPRDFLAAALDEQEKRWLAQCESIDAKDLLDRHRHNLPDWLAQPLREQLGDEFWALADSLYQPAPLDLRVNLLTDKREDVRRELELAGLQAEPTPYSPWGLRLAGKPALARLDAFARGAIEVQDEGSQLLALLLEARRGEMVVDFCAGAGGKTLALGAAMRNTGRLYAFDTSAHRLDALKPRLARSRLTQRAPGGDRPRARRAHQAPGGQDRPGARRCALLGAGHAAPQPGPEVAPEPEAGAGDGRQTGRHPAQRGPPAQARRAPGLRHLQRAARGKRSHRRGFQRRSTGLRSLAGGRHSCSTWASAPTSG